MPDEGNVRYGVSNAVVCVDGKYVPVGEISELEFVGSASDESKLFGKAFSAQPEMYSISFDFPWWSDPRIRFIRLIGWDNCTFLKHKCPYTVRSLRRGGKSHRGKHV